MSCHKRTIISESDMLIFNVKNKYMTNNINLTTYKFWGILTFSVCFPPNESRDTFGEMASCVHIYYLIILFLNY